eukprot:TRINITY_DN2153_c0_g2_i1.p1 TRINITY_DN2153_c0_g2~~TRINITY_DN2153_c0_g2_i1.p1  ORF type:complete len:463 (-),score=175.63 TRINITY_DN2153_c0_g2_i1:89-1477(-)
MHLLNLGGPGWFEDVLNVEIKVVTDRELTASTEDGTNKIPLVVLGQDNKISGTLKISAPEKHSVYQYGVVAKFQTTISFYETLRTVEMSEYATTVLEEGYVNGSMEVPFTLDLSGRTIPETYDGESVSLRHLIVFDVNRPWYTFNVEKSVDFAIHVIHPAPSQEEVELQQQMIQRPQTLSAPPAYGDAEILPESIPNELGSSTPPPMRSEKPAAHTETERHTQSDGATEGVQLKSETKAGEETVEEDKSVKENAEKKTEEKDDKSEGTEEDKSVNNDINDEEDENDEEENAEDEDEDLPSNYTQEDLDDGQTPVLLIPDCNGTCKFFYGSRHLNVDDTVSGFLEFKNIVKPLTTAELFFLRLESADEENYESLIHHEVLLHPDQPPIPVQNKPRRIPVTLKLGDINKLTPTYTHVNGAEADGFSVRYFIRLLVTDTDGNKFWNTHELAIYRKRGGGSNMIVV